MAEASSVSSEAKVPAPDHTEHPRAPDSTIPDAPSKAESPSRPAEDSSAQPEAEEVPKANGDVAEQPSSDPAPEETAAEPEKEIGAKASTEIVPKTPVSTKKSTNGSAKKKSNAVPEHRSKKLKKKKSKVTLNLEATPGDLYLARMRGHQPWPSIICDEDMLPQVLLSNRPVTAALPDGSFKRAEYADGGKRAGERTFPIMFLATNEFAWMPNTDLTPLAVEDAKEYPEKVKAKALIEAYKIASEGHDLAHFKKLLSEHQEALIEDAEKRAEREAKKAKKGKRKSDMSADEDEDEEAAADEMDIDEEVEQPKSTSKKRKKGVETDDADEKPTKTPKTSTKLKLTTPKTPVSEPSTKKKALKTKPSTKKTPAKANGSDEDGEDTPVVEEKPLTPAEAKEKKEKEIRYYRHKLQKGFLSRDTVPNDEEIKSMSTYLTKLETYPDLEGSIIRATKIHKVLKAMIRLDSIPKDDEFNFKKRSVELLHMWNKILADDPAPITGEDRDGDKDDEKPIEKPAANGVGKEEEAEAEKPEASEPAVSAAKDEEEKETIQRESPAEGIKASEPAPADKPESAETPVARDAVEATA